MEKDSLIEDKQTYDDPNNKFINNVVDKLKQNASLQCGKNTNELYLGSAKNQLYYMLQKIKEQCPSAKMDIHETLGDYSCPWICKGRHIKLTIYFYTNTSAKPWRTKCRTFYNRKNKKNCV